MGVSTVEAHLSHVYRKLGVRRAELAAHLAKPGDEAAQACLTTRTRTRPHQHIDDRPRVPRRAEALV